jgi:prevent-host-death family protein
MRTINIRDVRSHLSRLVDQAAKGEAFVIAKAGKPLVKVVPFDAPAPVAVGRLGFLAGSISVPDDFDSMGRNEIEDMFDGGH